MSGFLCLYIAQFPAWVWEQSTPKFQGQPFAVIERGQVVSVSAPALEVGVAPGMTSNKAQAHWNARKSQTAPLQLIERDRRREELAWSEVQRAVYGLTPKVEPLEMGTLFAEVASGKALPLVRGLLMHGGYAGDRATAHMAAVSAPHRVLRTIQAGRERAFADAFPLSGLRALGISAPTLQRLSWFGWQRLGQLRPLSRRQLEEQFGAEGSILFLLAQGAQSLVNRRPVATWQPPQEVVATIEFDLPAREPAEWDGALDELLECACEGLGTQQAQTLEIEARTPIAPLLARRVLKEPISCAKMLRSPTDSALRQALKTIAPLEPIVQALTVRLGGLTSAPVQESLFVDDVGERGKRLERAIEGIESRFAGKAGHYLLSDPHALFPEDAYQWMGALEALQREKDKPKAKTTNSRWSKGGK